MYFQEWIFLLREMVLKVPGVFGLSSLGPLCSDDPEKDFFNNILHLQVIFLSFPIFEV